jgi:hypothetical protein
MSEGDYINLLRLLVMILGFILACFQLERVSRSNKAQALGAIYDKYFSEDFGNSVKLLIEYVDTLKGDDGRVPLEPDSRVPNNQSKISDARRTVKSYYEKAYLLREHGLLSTADIQLVTCPADRRRDLMELILPLDIRESQTWEQFVHEDWDMYCFYSNLHPLDGQLDANWVGYISDCESMAEKKGWNRPYRIAGC